MKKKVFMMLPCIAAIAIVSGYGSIKTYQSHTYDKYDLLTANVEALSDTESNGVRIKCYTSLTYEAGASVVKCTTCKSVSNYTDKWYNIHDYCFQ